jgi:hypothetical protein
MSLSSSRRGHDIDARREDHVEIFLWVVIVVRVIRVVVI